MCLNKVTLPKFLESERVKSVIIPRTKHENLFLKYCL